MSKKLKFAVCLSVLAPVAIVATPVAAQGTAGAMKKPAMTKKSAPMKSGAMKSAPMKSGAMKGGAMKSGATKGAAAKDSSKKGGADPLNAAAGKKM